MITRPLELESRLSPPPRDLDFVAWVNVAVIVLFFCLLGSDFVLKPGLVVGVGGKGAIELPAVDPATANEGLGGVKSVVVSYRRDNVILFEGGMYSLAELRKQFEGYAKSHPGSVLLVHFDRQVSMQAFVDLSAMARSVGFANVLVAFEPQDAESAPK